MASTSGDFGGPNAPLQCTAMSKRSKQQCKGPAVVGSKNQKCRMHGGKVLVGAANPSFKHGRYSRYLPSHIDELYQQALSNPDLLEMSDHIALLEARINDILKAMAGGDPVPRWSQFAEAFGEFETALLSKDEGRVIPALEAIHKLLENGKKWDRSWDDIQGTLEQLRKMADTEVKRKKELHQMVPIERVVALMAAVATAVKRNVKNPIEIQAVYRELELMRTTNGTIGDRNVERMGPEVINVSPQLLGPSGGGSAPALARTRRAKEANASSAQ